MAYLFLCLTYSPKPHLYIQNTSLSHSFWQLMTLPMDNTIHRANNNDVFFLLATCLLMSLKEQLPEVSRMAVNQMVLYAHL